MSHPLSFLSRLPVSRLRLMVLYAIAGAVLSGCNGEDYNSSARSRQPLSAKTLALIEDKGMTPNSPILIRTYKQEAELEVWKQKRDGQYALLKVYPICRWSGDLGPKVKVGDRQTPEGFYTITPGQMNPNSNYYLSFNIGFPNAYDRSFGRTGEYLMVHGDCSSAGCYSMTDEQIAEIYALGREALAGGQKSFQVQALPFRMTPANMARYRNNPNMPFWKNLKEGVDAFDVTLSEPKVNVCNHRYVFNADAGPGRGFDASAPCPNYTVPPALAQAVSAKQHADEERTAALIASTPTMPSRAGIDGGMHPVFLASYKAENPSEDLGRTVPAGLAPGTMPGRTTRPPQVAEDGFSPIGSALNTHVTTNRYSNSVLALARPADTPDPTLLALEPQETSASGSNPKLVRPKPSVAATSAPTASFSQQTASLSSGGAAPAGTTSASATDIFSNSAR